MATNGISFADKGNYFLEKKDFCKENYQHSPLCNDRSYTPKLPESSPYE